MTEYLKKGDLVTWDTPQGETKGTVEKKLTAPVKIKGHEAKASAHRPDELRKAGK